MGVVNRTAATELAGLTEQLRHMAALNGAAADKYDDMTEFTGSMGVFLDVRCLDPSSLEPVIYNLLMIFCIRTKWSRSLFP